MIIFIDVKNGKVDLTKEQFERILKEKYNEGYNDGTKIITTSTWSCPYYSWCCPYRPSSRPYITWCDSTTGTPTTTTTTTVSASNISKKSDTVTLANSNINSGDTVTNGTVKINYNEVT